MRMRMRVTENGGTVGSEGVVLLLLLLMVVVVVGRGLIVVI